MALGGGAEVDEEQEIDDGSDEGGAQDQVASDDDGGRWRPFGQVGLVRWFRRGGPRMRPGAFLRERGLEELCGRPTLLTRPATDPGAGRHLAQAVGVQRAGLAVAADDDIAARMPRAEACCTLAPCLTSSRGRPFSRPPSVSSQ